MIIHLLPNDIPKCWEVIKTACKAADNVPESELTVYMTELLHDLLSEASHCFVRLHEEAIIAVMVAKIKVNKVSGDRSLYLQCLYSWTISGIDTWKQDADFVRQFAQKEKCSTITLDSSNPNIWKLVEQFGFVEKSRAYVAYIGR